MQALHSQWHESVYLSRELCCQYGNIGTPVYDREIPIEMSACWDFDVRAVVRDWVFVIQASEEDWVYYS